MKENDELKIQNGNDDARAVQRSELLPIYDVMPFSGDIQPLEDIVEEEYITADYLVKSSDKGEKDNLGDLNKKKIPLIGVLNKKYLRYIMIFAVVLVVGGICVGGIALVTHMRTNESPVSTIFVRDGKTIVNLEDSSEYTLTKVEQIKVSNNGMSACFSRNSDSYVGKFDINYLDISMKRSLKKEGTFIERDVDENWSISADGNFIAYTKTNGDNKKGYIYSTKTGESIEISSSVEEIFFPPSGDVIYYTRKNGKTYSLHRLRYGEESQNVASEIKFVKFVRSDNGYEVIYTTDSDNGTDLDVFRVNNQNSPVKICSGVSEVYLNDYVYGGNLYCFVKNKSEFNWQDFITDNYYDSDMTLKRPVEGDYLVEKGFVFKRNVLDTAAYDAALKKYNAKLMRDEIRQELDSLDIGLAVKDSYTCYVYVGGVVQKLAAGMTLDDIIDTSADGMPGIIYSKSTVRINSPISMDTLVKIASNGTVGDAADFVRDTIGKSDKLKSNSFYSYFDGSKVLEYSLSDFDITKTQFIFFSSKSFYSICDGKLYCSNLGDNKVERGSSIDENVSACEVRGDYLYYTKLSENGSDTSLWRVRPGEKVSMISDKISSYLFNNNGVIVMNNSASETFDLKYYYNGKLNVIDNSVYMRGFTYNDNGFAYIKSDNDNTMYIHTLNGEKITVSDNVTDILYIN